jgi:hypothetical protein
VWSIHIGRIKERDTEIQRTMDSGDRLLVVATAVKIRHPHATKTDRGDNRTASSKLSLFHDGSTAVYLKLCRRSGHVEPSRDISNFFFKRFDSLTSRSLTSGLLVYVTASPAAPFSTSLRFARNDKNLHAC